MGLVKTNAVQLPIIHAIIAKFFPKDETTTICDFLGTIGRIRNTGEVLRRKAKHIQEIKPLIINKVHILAQEFFDMYGATINNALGISLKDNTCEFNILCSNKLFTNFIK